MHFFFSGILFFFFFARFGLLRCVFRFAVICVGGTAGINFNKSTLDGAIAHTIRCFGCIKVHSVGGARKRFVHFDSQLFLQSFGMCSFCILQFRGQLCDYCRDNSHGTGRGRGGGGGGTPRVGVIFIKVCKRHLTFITLD